jgi:exopolysaccharide production protein ExoQ
MIDAKPRAHSCTGMAAPGELGAPPAGRASHVLLGLMLCVFCALPFLLGDQARSLTSVKESGITSPQGDAAKQFILMGMYALTALALFRRLSASTLRAVGLPLFCLLIWLGLSTLWSDMPGITLRRTVALGGTLTLGTYLAVSYSPQRLVRLLSMVALVVLGASFLVGVLMPAAGLDAEHRLRGVFAHKNSLAAFAAVALICAVDAMTGLSGKKPGRLAWLTGLFGIVALVMTASASPVPAVAVAAFVIVRIKHADSGLPHLLTTRLCTVLFTAVVLLPWLAPYFGQLALLFGRSTDFSGRTLVWRFAIEFFQRNPLFGYGYASFWNGPAGLLFVQYAHFPVPHAHNGALQFLIDCGAIGLVLYGTVLAGAIRGLDWILHALPRKEYAWLGGYLVLYLFASLAETHLLEPNDLYAVLFTYAVVRINLICRLDQFRSR